MYLFLKGELSLKYSKKIEQEITLESYIINEFNIDYLHSDNKIIFKDPNEKIIKRKTFRRPALKNSVKDLDFNTQKIISSTPRISTFHLNEFDTENECYKITSERFISQNNLISFTPHSIDCFISSEDSLILVLDKKSFNMSLQKNFLKVDNEYKKFICTRLPFFTSFTPETLNLYFFSWIKIYPKLNEQIYSINEEANYFYLIYSGECANVINNKYINFYNKGSFFGLDSLFNPEKKYTNTIICKDPNTIIFRFNPYTFNEKISNLLKKNLFHYYSISFQNSNEFLQKYEDMSLRFEYNYFHLSKNFKKKKFKRIEEIANLLEKNPINISSLTERNNKKRNNNLKIQKNLFLSLDNLNPSFIHKTNSYLNSIKNSFEKEKSETKKIKLKKKRSVIKLEKTNILYLKKVKKPINKKRISNSIKSQLNNSKLKFKTLYLGKEIK
jgi:CRP-like cAMP-binding protein